ncbi:alpha/beta hydrolase-fold protein [Chryseobacterium camelliae]|uniref:alpha/beta hydrolase-fold protein n=1 Tax=Chryseobacterium camelliae TaxID=1265445 RepID=UPI0027D80AB7|nr:alpha/beta hydrolase-fold protein [Chryseobacterium camelliae]
MLGLSAIVSAQNSNVKPLTIGEIRTFKSKILNEERTLNIYLPQNFDKTKSYPVIYLLDGSMNEDFISCYRTDSVFQSDVFDAGNNCGRNSQY